MKIKAKKKHMNTNYYYATSAQASERKYSKKQKNKRYLKQRKE